MCNEPIRYVTRQTLQRLREKKDVADSHSREFDELLAVLHPLVRIPVVPAYTHTDGADPSRQLMRCILTAPRNGRSIANPEDIINLEVDMPIDAFLKLKEPGAGPA